MRTLSIRSLAVPAAAVLAPLGVALVPAASPASGAALNNGGSPWDHHTLAAHTILVGSSLTHTFTVSGTSTVKSEPLSSPDDITMLGRDIFVGFQNGVGPQGRPARMATWTAPSSR